MKNCDILRKIWKFKVAEKDGSHVKGSKKWYRQVGWGEIEYQDKEEDNFLGNRKLKERIGSSVLVFFSFG